MNTEMLDLCCVNLDPPTIRLINPTGLIVLRRILKDAKVISVTDARVAFIKPGGYSQALRDFHALKPDKIDELSTKLDNGVVSIK